MINKELREAINGVEQKGLYIRPVLNKFFKTTSNIFTDNKYIDSKKSVNKKFSNDFKGNTINKIFTKEIKEEELFKIEDNIKNKREYLANKLSIYMIELLKDIENDIYNELEKNINIIKTNDLLNELLKILDTNKEIGTDPDLIENNFTIIVNKEAFKKIQKDININQLFINDYIEIDENLKEEENIEPYIYIIPKAKVAISFMNKGEADVLFKKKGTEGIYEMIAEVEFKIGGIDEGLYTKIILE